MKFVTVLILLIGLCVQNAFAQSVQITKAEVRAPIPGMENTVAYMQLVNSSDENIELVSAYSTFAKKVEIHDHIMSDGVMKMIKLDNLVVKANETKIFESGGLHLMLIGLNRSEARNKDVNITFVLKDGTELTSVFNVKSIHQHHNH